MGDNGQNGATGDAGANGPNGTDGTSRRTAGLQVALTVSSPANGQFFVVGEQPVLTIQLTGSAGVLLASELGTAELFAYGPRLGSQTKTASKLLNAVTNRSAADRQHHFINLKAPSYADSAQQNLAVAADGTLTFTMAPVSDEAPGTYTVGVWAKSADEIDQIFQLADLQLGTSEVEAYASGAPGTGSCAACHLGPLSGKSYEAHIIPSAFSTEGNFALDDGPIGTCKACHNLDGYSANPIVRKVHGVHRGEHQANAGVAHPEYGLGADTSLPDFLNVAFPSMPSAEKDCTACHVDDRWKTKPSRLACGTCHDNLFFDTGTFSPAQVLGKPSSGACVADFQCLAFSPIGVCNVGSGFCEQGNHPMQTDDSQCSTCHPPDTGGLAAIAKVHALPTRSAVPGLKITEVALSGGSGPNSSFAVGDTITATFKLQDGAGNLISTLKTDSSYSPSVVVGGPTDSRQRLIGSINPKTTGTLSYDSVAGRYTYVFPTTLPAAPLAPLNTTTPVRTSNPPGTYTLWLWIGHTVTVNGARVTDAASGIANFAFGADLPIQPRQVISESACQTCHVQFQVHGGSRRSPEQCSLCHTGGAVDRIVGARGVACTTDSACPGFGAGWEACQAPDAGVCSGSGCTCAITVDPTPNQTIDFRAFMHDLHFARLRGGAAEQGNLWGGKLVVIGFNNSANNFSEVLFPQDVRNCTKCHADTLASCSAAQPCGIGQRCESGKCMNVAWKQPTTIACTSCHDSATAIAHAQLMTWSDPSGQPVESCTVCHGEGAAYAIDLVHKIRDPYVPVYSREPAP